ncbi:MAG: sulfite exporter TauE/SafE family protein [Eubacterium sp.]|nr:sulfite exporter TauE/SafE family protein [Eubacterium sp.]
MKKSVNYLLGGLCGVLNGLFGSGGGVVAVPCLEKSGLEAKKAHATSVALIFILSMFTTALYFVQGKIDIALAWDYIPWGLGGSIAGAMLLNRIPNSLLRRVFGIMILVSAVRILLS